MFSTKKKKASEAVGETYAALQGPAVDEIAIHLADGHRSGLVALHLDEGESAIGLEAGLHHVTKVLEQGHHVVRRRVRSQVSDVTGRLPGRGLSQDHIVARHAVGGELMVTKRCRRGHPHRGHGLLLSDGGLALLVSPVAADGPRAQPLAIHGAESLLSVTTFTEGDESVSTRAARLHIPHDSCLRYRPEGRESLEEDLVVDLVRQVANEDVEMARGILLVRAIRLIGPVDSDLLCYVVSYPFSSNSGGDTKPTD